MLKKSSKIFFFFFFLISFFFLLNWFLEIKNSSGNNIYYFKDRYLLFSSNRNKLVFNNHKKNFSYSENDKIKAIAYYSINNNWFKEYEYTFGTNNYGMVQNKNLNKDKPILLFLGDSAQEGQGFNYFSDFETELDDYHMQLANGGYMGASVAQFYYTFLRLRKEKGLPIKKIFVVLISDDVFRPILTIKKEDNLCIQNFLLCTGENNFLGVPKKEERLLFLDRIKNMRNNPKQKNFKYFLKKIYLVRASYYLITRRANLKSNIDFIEKFNSLNIPVFFLHLPMKDEIFLNKFKKNSNFVKKITKNNYFNMQDMCNFQKEDYFKYDGHFNKSGYTKWKNCLKKFIVKEKHLEINKNN